MCTSTAASNRAAPPCRIPLPKPSLQVHTAGLPCRPAARPAARGSPPRGRKSGPWRHNWHRGRVTYERPPQCLRRPRVLEEHGSATAARRTSEETPGAATHSSTKRSAARHLSRSRERCQRAWGKRVRRGRGRACDHRFGRRLIAGHGRTARRPRKHRPDVQDDGAPTPWQASWKRTEVPHRQARVLRPPASAPRRWL